MKESKGKECKANTCQPHLRFFDPPTKEFFRPFSRWMALPFFRLIIPAWWKIECSVREGRKRSRCANKHPKKSWADICCEESGAPRMHGMAEDVYRSSEREISPYFAYNLPGWMDGCQCRVLKIRWWSLLHNTQLGQAPKYYDPRLLKAHPSMLTAMSSIP